MKKLFTFIHIFVLFFNHTSAQKQDYLWLFGYNSTPPTTNPDWGGTNIDFNITPENIYRQDRIMDLRDTNASICDKNGNILFYTNGIYIANKENEPMENGLNLSPGQYSTDHLEDGYLIPQSALILPQSFNDDIYYTIHKNIEYPSDTLDWHSSILYYSIIDMNENEGLGKVIEKNKIVIQDTLNTGTITATRHANGRDWWLLSNELNSNSYHRTLLSYNGITTIKAQTVGTMVPKGGGQAVFAPDGSRFALITANDITVGYLNIYDFDRCSGELSNHLQLILNEETIFPGVAISSSSQFLYVCASQNLYQYDLWADDIAATKDTVAIWDGFVSPFPTGFYLAQLASNDKIYINTFSGTNILHVIHQPNLRGNACQVEQRGIDLPTYNSGSMPNFPNYRLGALEGSSCDTIVSSTATPVASIRKVEVYPNPAQDYLAVAVTESFKTNVPIELTDIYGKVVFKSNLPAQSETVQLRFTDIPSGMYVLRLITDGGLLSNKIIVSSK